MLYNTNANESRKVRFVAALTDELQTFIHICDLTSYKKPSEQLALFSRVKTRSLPVCAGELFINTNVIAVGQSTWAQLGGGLPNASRTSGTLPPH